MKSDYRLYYCAMMFAPTFALVLGLMPISATSSPYDIDPLTEGLLTGGMLVWSFLADGLIKDDVYRQPACRHRPDETICDPDQLNALDRTVVGNDSKTWRLTSDVVGIGTLALPFALEAVDVWLSDSETGASDYMTDLLVVTEAVALTTFITGLTKWAVARPRPTQYSELTDNKYGLPEHQRSFPSGHTSSTTAAAVAYATTYGLRNPESPWRWAVYGGAATLSLVTGYARVGGGMHFYTDVMASTVLGTVIGIVVPMWHRREQPVRVSIHTPDASGESGYGVSLSGHF